MGKYNYDKKVLEGLSVGPFLGEVKERNRKIEEADNDMPKSIFNANLIATSLHPHKQPAVIREVIKRNGAKTFVFEHADPRKKLAYFRAGQYVCVYLTIGGSVLQRPYAIQSNPKDALKKKSTYAITVKKVPDGFASDYILKNWKEGDIVELSAPIGEFYYERLRDAKNVIAVAGGSGITPFFSMAAAICSGAENFNLTILYGSRNARSILLRKELDELCKASKGKVKVVHVLSEEETKTHEHGFITADLIAKYAPDDDYSVFVCGPKALYDFMDKELPKLSLPLRRIRYEVRGEFGDPASDPAYPTEAAGKTYSMKVLARDKEYTVPVKSSETILSALERAGIAAPSHCRSGECGFCHSRLVSGTVFAPESADGRREADIKFGWIHPCCSYATSDLTVEVFPVVMK